MATHPFQTDDARLHPIKDKVLAGERLDEADALVLYATGDILAVGWLANWVRERMHGDTAYFNVNRHINPTNVCVAACRLCAFGRKKDTPGAYTMALEEAFQTAASGYTEAVTEFHIVGGLHPDLPFQYFLDLVSGLKERLTSPMTRSSTLVGRPSVCGAAKPSCPRFSRKRVPPARWKCPSKPAHVRSEVILPQRIESRQCFLAV